MGGAAPGPPPRADAAPCWSRRGAAHCARAGTAPCRPPPTQHAQPSPGANAYRKAISTSIYLYIHTHAAIVLSLRNVSITSSDCAFDVSSPSVTSQLEHTTHGFRCHQPLRKSVKLGDCPYKHNSRKTTYTVLKDTKQNKIPVYVITIFTPFRGTIF